MSVEARFFPFLPITDFSFMKNTSSKDCVWFGAIVLVGLATTTTLVKFFAWNASLNIASGILPTIAMIAYSILKQNKLVNEIKTDKGDAVDTNFQTGINYFNGNGVEKNLDEALKYFRESGKMGNGEAHFFVGKIYERKKDYTKAITYYLKAKDLNNVAATRRIGYMYEKGISFEPNFSLALDYYLKAKIMQNNSINSLPLKA